MSVAPPPMCPATSALVRLESALLFLREHWPMQTDTARVRWFVRGPRVAPHVDLHVWSDRTDPALPAVRVLRPYGSQETLALRLEQARAEFDRGVDVWQPAVPAALQALERFLPSDPRSTAHGWYFADFQAGLAAWSTHWLPARLRELAGERSLPPSLPAHSRPRL